MSCSMKLLNDRLKEYEPLFREYRIVEQIGNGGSSRVFRAESPSGHLVAIKVISIPSTDEWESMGGTEINAKKAAALVKRSAELLQRTRQEYECAQKLERSDYTVKVLDFEEKSFPLLPDSQIMGTDILIRMDCQDSDLNEWAKKLGRPFFEQEILQVGHNVLSALMDLHSVNIKHRDVKPKNIFVSDYHGRRYKLGDFGSSRIATGNTMETLPSAGTRGFMAPEELSGHPEFSSDLYSVGIVLYWMASGVEPDPIVAASDWKRPDGLSDGIWSIIQIACAHSLEERFLCASEMRDAMNKIDPHINQASICEKKEEEKHMKNGTTGTTNKVSRKKSRLGIAAILASVLLLAASATGVLGHALNQPVNEKEFQQTYYTQNKEFDNLQSDYQFEIKTDGSTKGAYVGVTAPSATTVPFGGDISVTLRYTGDIASVWLGSGSVVLNGFCATKTLKQISDNEITLLLTNIQAAETGNDSPKTIAITGGTGVNPSGDMTNSVTSSEFIITSPAMERLVNALYDVWLYLLLVGLSLLGFTLYIYLKNGKKAM